MIEATCIADSISPDGVRLLTVKGKVPETIWNEILTHRVFSRNSSSSRAVPVAKWIAETRDPALRVTPMRWGANRPGMQPGDELTGDARRLLMDLWEQAAFDAARAAENMAMYGAHKEIVNQVLKPYVHAHVVITATEWMNFFGLRLDSHAKIEIRIFAEQVWKIWNEHEPQQLQPGEWHLPFVEADDLFDHMGRLSRSLDDAIKISIARCARISYESYETGRRSTVVQDIALHDRLLADRHLSPFEHQATPDEPTMWGEERATAEQIGWNHSEEHGNFTGWRQRRKQIPGEAIAPMAIYWNKY